MSPRISRWAVVAAAVANASCVPHCPAQWTAIHLHDPTVFRSSAILGITATQEFGVGIRVASPSQFQATIWNGTSASWTDLAPGYSAKINGIGGGQQVGESSSVGGVCLWNGTPGSIVGLHPFNALGAEAIATDGQTQVGYYIPTAGATRRAVLWHGSAASAVSLHPVGSITSQANAVVGETQGGSASYPDPTFGEVFRAVLWNGTAQSSTSLHPGTQYHASVLAGMVAGQQVGTAATVGGPNHAALWFGTAASFVDMNPPNAGLSHLLATCGSAQVGSANIPGLGNTAGIWFGTPSSFVPLAPFLPPGYFQSTATCVAQSNGTFYVGGYARNSITHQDEAFMWVGVPEPAAPGVLLLSFALLRRRRTAWALTDPSRPG